MANKEQPIKTGSDEQLELNLPIKTGSDEQQSEQQPEHFLDFSDIKFQQPKNEHEFAAAVVDMIKFILVYNSQFNQITEPGEESLRGIAKRLTRKVLIGRFMK